MLHELFQYLRNPGNQFARKLGYSKELIAIDARYRRNKKYWQSHLENSKKVIIEACHRCPEKDTVMILGAGLLYDIPLNFLLDTFKTIYLVDVAFSMQAKKLEKKHNSIKLLTHDLNGLENQVLIKSQLNTLPRIRACLPKIKARPDLIVSANVLSQLYLAPIHLLDQKGSFSDEQLTGFAKEIVQSHINLLKQQPGIVCLITDHYRFTINEANNREQESALLDIQLPEPDYSWPWQLAPKGEISRQQSLETLVYAYTNFNR